MVVVYPPKGGQNAPTLKARTQSAGFLVLSRTIAKASINEIFVTTSNRCIVWPHEHAC